MPIKFKSLELQGYKTFASRTVFEFSDTITAIIGPNGSGKSNIADSIRWVLGEQSFHLLRGKKTEDMIYTGSELRARAGMASATITFDNTNGWLPIDFSEVAITRRAYRDGQNEYLINGQHVRLKDISELLAQSGLSERTYTIIGQGLVDAALTLNPEERRKLFEEAAGISLHRSRKDEALRRLENTKRNLERVQYILGELLPRLNSLEKQAKRALEYEQIRTNLKNLLREWYGYHWHQAQKEVEKARELTRNQETSLLINRNKYTELVNSITVIREKNKSIRLQLDHYQRLLTEDHRIMENIQRSLAVLEEREKSLFVQESSILSEKARLEAYVDEIKQRIFQANENIMEFEAEEKELNNKREVTLEQFRKHQVEWERIEQNTFQLQDELIRFENLSRNNELNQEDRKTSIVKNQKNKEQALQNLSQYRNNINNLENELTQLIIQIDEVKNKKETIEDGLSKLGESILEKQTHHQDLLKTKLELEVQITKFRTQLDIIEKSENALDGYALGSKFLLDSFYEKKISGILGTLNQIIFVPKEFELAISTVLGEYVDSILVANQLDRIMDYMLENSVGGILLHQARNSLNELDDFPIKVPGVIGIASKLIQVDDEKRIWVNKLLGKVIVVKDKNVVKNIFELFEKAPDDWAKIVENLRVVTLKGELFDINGIVILGNRNSRGQLLFSKSRQRVELEKELNEAQSQLAKLLKNLEESNEILQNLKTKESELQQQHDDILQIELNVEQKINHINNSKSVMEQQILWFEERINNINDEIERNEIALTELKHNSEELRNNISLLEGELKYQKQLLTLIPIDMDKAELEEWNIKIAVIQRALLEEKNRINELTGQFSAQIKILETLAIQEKENQLAKENIIIERHSLLEKENHTNLDVKSIQESIKPLEEELSLNEIKLTGLEEEETVLRSNITIAEQHSAQTRLGLIRKQEAMAVLKDRIEEDFGLVAFEYTGGVSGQTPLPIEGMVEQLPMIKQIPPELEDAVRRQRSLLRRFGPINQDALTEYNEVKQRYEFLLSQVADLEAADANLREVIQELDLLIQKEFQRTFQAVADEFGKIFVRLFGGGSAKLILTDSEKLSETGVEIEAKLPGRRTQGLSLLSGGERSLTAVALVFALLKISPTPFCLLDEVDAMLDEANIQRFSDLLKELSQNTQFVIVTHNRFTAQTANIIYGVTLGRDLSSQVLSLNLSEVSKMELD